MRSGLGFLLGIVTLLSTACSGESGIQDGPSGVTVRDSAGVSIIENPRLDLTKELIRRREPAVRIGVVDGAEEYQLNRVTDIKRLSDGAIAVADGGNRDLKIYERDGTHRATTGGAGGGPGEFRYPQALVILPGDTVQVQDFYDRVYFGPDGTFLRRVPGDRRSFRALWDTLGGMSEGGQWMADGTYLAPVYFWDQNPPKAGPPFRPPITFVRVSEDFSLVDTLGSFGGIRQQYVEVGGQRGVMPIVPPFSTNTFWALGSADGMVVLGDNASPQIHRFHADGTHSIVRWEADADPLTGVEIEAWKDEQRNSEWSRGQLPELERGWAAMDVPESKAYYGQVVAGSDGWLWVSPIDYPADTTRLVAFDHRGYFAGTVGIPGRFVVFDSGPGWMIGLRRDENNVEFIQVYELRIP